MLNSPSKVNSVQQNLTCKHLLRIPFEKQSTTHQGVCGSLSPPPVYINQARSWQTDSDIKYNFIPWFTECQAFSVQTQSAGRNAAGGGPAFHPCFLPDRGFLRNQRDTDIGIHWFHPGSDPHSCKGYLHIHWCLSHSDLLHSQVNRYTDNH